MAQSFLNYTPVPPILNGGGGERRRGVNAHLFESHADGGRLLDSVLSGGVGHKLFTHN